MVILALSCAENDRSSCWCSRLLNHRHCPDMGLVFIVICLYFVPCMYLCNYNGQQTTSSLYTQTVSSTDITQIYMGLVFIVICLYFVPCSYVFTSVITLSSSCARWNGGSRHWKHSWRTRKTASWNPTGILPSERLWEMTLNTLSISM